MVLGLDVYVNYLNPSHTFDSRGLHQSKCDNTDISREESNLRLFSAILDRVSGTINLLQLNFKPVGGWIGKGYIEGEH